MNGLKSEVFRYLGRKGQAVSDELDGMVSESISLMRDTVKPMHVQARFTANSEYVQRLELPGYLKNCSEIVIFAATLGTAADTLIQKWKYIDLTRALVLDACATAIIEEYCDKIERDVCEKAYESGLMASRRISPGYGDFKLESGAKILFMLKGDRTIGLTCTDSHIMLPRKSVTAVIGLGQGLSREQAGKKCENCNMRSTCNYGEGH